MLRKGDKVIVNNKLARKRYGQTARAKWDYYTSSGEVTVTFNDGCSGKYYMKDLIKITPEMEAFHEGFKAGASNKLAKGDYLQIICEKLIENDVVPEMLDSVMAAVVNEALTEIEKREEEQRTNLLLNSGNNARLCI